MTLPGLGYRDRLLFHGLVYRRPLCVVHLAKLVDQAVAQACRRARARHPSSVHSRVTDGILARARRGTNRGGAPGRLRRRTDRWAIFSTYLRNCDLAVPAGSPSRSTLISPRMRSLRLTSFGTLSKSERATEVLIPRWRDGLDNALADALRLGVDPRECVDLAFVVFC